MPRFRISIPRPGVGEIYGSLYIVRESSIRTGKPSLRIWRGKQGSPYLNFYYNSEEKREEAITREKANEDSYQALKASRKADKKFDSHTIKPGDLFYTSWGYDQTNIDFYQVVRLIGKTQVGVRKIKAASHEGTGWMQGEITPGKNQFVESGKEFRCAVQKSGDSFHFSVEGHHASPTKEGQKHHYTAYA